MTEIQYKADVYSASGYARASRGNIRALIEGGNKVKLEPVRHDNIHVTHDDFWEENLPKILEAQFKPKLRVTQQTPDMFQPSPEFHEVGYTVFETSKIPTEWIPHMNKCQRIWTASEFCKNMFIESGVEVPVDVFPHPIDLTVYKPGPKVMIESGRDRINSDGKMIFLSVFQWNKRKDPTSLLLAWWSEFRDNPDVQLLIKTYGNDFISNHHILSAVRKIRTEAGITDKNSIGNIHFMTGELEEERMPDLYRSADVLISTSRGEGFGLPMQEAQACGIPCIYPDSTSMKEFCVGWSVQTYREPAYGVGSPWYNIESDWWTVNLEHLRVQMREAYNIWLSNGKKIPEATKKAAREAIIPHSYPELAKRFNDCLVNMDV